MTLGVYSVDVQWRSGDATSVKLELVVSITGSSVTIQQQESVLLYPSYCNNNYGASTNAVMTPHRLGMP